MENYIYVYFFLGVLTASLDLIYTYTRDEEASGIKNAHPICLGMGAMAIVLAWPIIIIMGFFLVLGKAIKVMFGVH